GIGNSIAAPAAAEYGVQIRQVGIDVGRQHRDLARLQRRVEAPAFGRVRLEQRAQLVVQHLKLAQAGVAGVDLQAGVAPVEGVAQREARRGATMEQVRLQAPQQARIENRTGVRVDFFLAIIEAGGSVGKSRL